MNRHPGASLTDNGRHKEFSDMRRNAYPASGPEQISRLHWQFCLISKNK